MTASGSPIAEATLAIGPDMADYKTQMENLKQHFTKSINDLQSGLAKTLNVGSVATSLRNALLPILGTISAISASKFGYSVYADAQRAAIGFEVFLSSAEKAQEMLQKIQVYADKTPYNLPGVRSSAMMLMQLGISAQNTMPMLKAIGDVATGDANKMHSLALALGQVNQAGRLMGGEMLQFINAGFNPLEYIARRTGESLVQVRERMHAGGVAVGEVEMAFVTATSAGGKFYQMAEKQSKATAGLLSTLQDTVTASAGRITKVFIKAFGVDDILKNMTKLTGGVESLIAANEGPITSVSKTIRQAAGQMYDGVKDKFLFLASALKSVLVPAFQTVQYVAERLNTSIPAVAGGFFVTAGAVLLASSAIGKINTMMTAFKTVSSTVLVSLNAIKAAITVTSAVFAATPIGVAVVAIGSLVAGGYALYAIFKKLSENNSELGKSMSDSFARAKEIMSNLWDGLVGFASFIKSGLNQAISAFGSVFKQVFGVDFFKSVDGMIQSISDFVRDSLDMISILTTDFGKTWELIKVVAHASLMQMYKINEAIWMGIKLVWAEGTEALMSYWRPMTTKLSEFGINAFANFRKQWAVTVQFVGDAWTTVVSNVRSVWVATQNVIAGGMARMIAQLTGQDVNEVLASLKEMQDAEENAFKTSAENAIRMRENEANKAMEKIELEREEALKANEEIHKAKVDQANKELAAARNGFEEALANAKKIAAVGSLAEIAKQLAEMKRLRDEKFAKKDEDKDEDDDKKKDDDDVMLNPDGVNGEGKHKHHKSTDTTGIKEMHNKIQGSLGSENSPMNAVSSNTKRTVDELIKLNSTFGDKTGKDKPPSVAEKIATTKKKKLEKIKSDKKKFIEETKKLKKNIIETKKSEKAGLKGNVKVPGGVGGNKVAGIGGLNAMHPANVMAAQASKNKGKESTAMDKLVSLSEAQAERDNRLIKAVEKNSVARYA